MNKKKSSKTRQIKQMASHGPRRPPAKDVTVTANRRPPSGGVTCAPATGRRGEPSKGKSKAGNKCKVCCGEGQDGTGTVSCYGNDALLGVLRWYRDGEVCCGDCQDWTGVVVSCY